MHTAPVEQRGPAWAGPDNCLSRRRYLRIVEVQSPAGALPPHRSLTMNLSKSVAELQREHVVLELECIDRMYLNAYVPQLTTEGGVAGFVRGYLGYRFASTKAVAQMTENFVESIMQFGLDHKIDLVRFKKGQRKDHVMQARLRAFKSINKEWSLSAWPRKRRACPERCARPLAMALRSHGSITGAPM